MADSLKNRGQAARLSYIPSSFMSLPQDNNAFWKSDGVHVAVNPHCPHEAEGLAEIERRVLSRWTRLPAFFAINQD